MSKSYKDQFKEESVRRRQRQQKQIAAVIILIGVLVSAAIWYLDGLSKETAGAAADISAAVGADC